MCLLLRYEHIFMFSLKHEQIATSLLNRLGLRRPAVPNRTLETSFELLFTVFREPGIGLHERPSKSSVGAVLADYRIANIEPAMGSAGPIPSLSINPSYTVPSRALTHAFKRVKPELGSPLPSKSLHGIDRFVDR